MQEITRLPSRPLRLQDVEQLDADDRLQVVPYGGVPENDEMQVYAIKIAVDETAYALGFDDSRGRWQQLGVVDAVDLAVADSQLNAILDNWVKDQYGTRFEVLKTV